MGTRGAPSVLSQNFSQGFATALMLAFHEWLLIFMLFIDASFSYLVTKFAGYCELKIPCPLCSRLDHVLEKNEVGFYWDLICGDHKSEISSLVLCHVHNKLVDVHEMCENCLSSFATTNKSDTETYQRLEGKMVADPQLELNHEPLFEEENLGSSGARICSCCNEHWVSRGHTQKLLQASSIGSLASEGDATLSVTAENNLKTIRHDSCVPYGGSSMGTISFNSPSPIRDRSAKITSVNNSEVPFADDNSVSIPICQTQGTKLDSNIQPLQMEPRVITLAQKFKRPASVPGASVLESEVQVEVMDHNVPTLGHGLEELNSEQVHHKANTSGPSELVSFDEVLSPNVVETLVEVSPETYASKTDEKKIVRGCSDISMVEREPTVVTETRFHENPLTADTGSQVPGNLELRDAYNLAVKGRQLSGKFSELKSLKDSARVSEDLKLLLSQISAARGIELSLNDISPRVSGFGEDLKDSDTSTSTSTSTSKGMQLLQKRFSLERNESNVSLDGTTVSDIEGESVVDRLTRQIEHDKKLMGALYKEIEEERNASAIATNQAMAMITRLQEEKAAVHMEAFQCVRMMEEQAEYDVEALENANDLRADKEKLIQDLEAKLELYRKKFGDVRLLENIMEPISDLEAGDLRVGRSDSSSSKYS